MNTTPMTRPTNASSVPTWLALVGLFVMLAAGAVVGGLAVYGLNKQPSAAGPVDDVQPPEQRAEGVPAVEKKPKYATLPADPLALEAAFKGKTRDQIQEKYGPPAAFENVMAGNYDGPTLVYRGQFKQQMTPGKFATRVDVYFRRTVTGESVCVSVVFNN